MGDDEQLDEPVPFWPTQDDEPEGAAVDDPAGRRGRSALVPVLGRRGAGSRQAPR